MIDKTTTDITKSDSAELEYRLAKLGDIDDLVLLVDEYHAFESISLTKEKCHAAISPLLDSQSRLGFIFVASENSECIGYIAICFGYSIEFCGRDAFIDEFYVRKAMQYKGVGSMLLQKVKDELTKHSIKALHLEVANDNLNAQAFYQKHGFSARKKFHLMSFDF